MNDDDALNIVISPQAGYSAVGGPAALQKAKDALGTLGHALASSVTQLRESLKTVDEVEVQMQLELSGEGKWVVVSVGATATVSVKLVWRNGKQPNGQASHV